MKPLKWLRNLRTRTGVLAAKAEDLAYRGLRIWGQYRGRVYRVLPLAGYGSEGACDGEAQDSESAATEQATAAAQSSADAEAPADFARIIARVLMVSPNTDRSEKLQDRRGYRQFLSIQVAGVPLSIRLGNARAETVSDRGGYVDIVLKNHGLSAGWHDASITVEGGDTTRLPVQVASKEPSLGIISDVDDTIMNTALPRPMLAFWNAFIAHTSTRSATSGMPKFFGALREQCPGPMFYLSTGAWNVIGNLRAFVKKHDYPRGSFLLTDWGPTNTGWFRSGSEHKRSQLRRLAAELPQITWVLVGDDGQHDPEIYNEFATQYPDRVERIVIRSLTKREHFLAHGTMAPLKVTRRELKKRNKISR